MTEVLILLACVLKDHIGTRWHPMILLFPHFVSYTSLLLNCLLQPSLTKPSPPFSDKTALCVAEFTPSESAEGKKTHNSHFLFSFHFENICFKFTAQIVGNKSDCDVMSNICIKKARGIKGWLKVHRVVRVRLFPIFDFSCCQMQHLAAREAQNISFSVSVSH